MRLSLDTVVQASGVGNQFASEFAWVPPVPLASGTPSRVAAIAHSPWRQPGVEESLYPLSREAAAASTPLNFAVTASQYDSSEIHPCRCPQDWCCRNCDVLVLAYDWAVAFHRFMAVE